MEKLRWYFKQETKFEEYSVMFYDGDYILVQNDNSKKYSYGLKRDFGTLFGFPVNQSCLTEKEAKDMLYAFIEIDKSYIDSLGDIAKNNIEIWSNMLLAIS